MDKMKKVKKKKRKMAKTLTFPHWDLKFEARIFEQDFPVQDLYFEGESINRTHCSYKISTLF